MEEKRMEKIWRFLKDEEGTETVEWAIVAGLIIVAAAALWSDVGQYVYDNISALVEALTPAS